MLAPGSLLFSSISSKQSNATAFGFEGISLPLFLDANEKSSYKGIQFHPITLAFNLQPLHDTATSHTLKFTETSLGFLQMQISSPKLRQGCTFLSKHRQVYAENLVLYKHYGIYLHLQKKMSLNSEKIKRALSKITFSAKPNEIFNKRPIRRV